MHALLLLFLIANFATVHCQFRPRFVNVAKQARLITNKPKSFKFGGPCVADLDGDGIYDLILSYHNSDKAQVFFGNLNGTFTLSSFRHKYFDVHGVNVAQRHANTRDRILSISVGGGSGTNLKKPLVYIVTPDRRFIDVTSRRGLGRVKTRGRSTLFMDLAKNNLRLNKGGPDLVFMSYLGNVRSYLKQFAFKNLGSQFRYRRIPGLEHENRGRVEVTDIDGDGIMEVVSIRELQVYKLAKPFVFADVTSQVMPEPYKSGDASFRNTAVAEIDFNNDGKFDLYVARADRRIVTRRTGTYPYGSTNDMLLQNRNGEYVDVSQEAGIPKRTNSVGVTAGDFNNDGYIDLLVIQWSEPDILLLNRGDGTFKRVNRVIPKSRKTRGDNAVAVDYDLDGRLDAVIGQGAPKGFRGPYLLMKNFLPRTKNTNYLLVRVYCAPGRRRTPLHALITVYVGKHKMVRHVGSSGAQAGGGSYLDTVHFGLGASKYAGWVIVRWSNKMIERKRGVAANQIVRFGLL